MKKEKDEVYQEIFIDNPKCNRRFHINFESDGDVISETSVTCPYCQATVLKRKNHPKLKFIRAENLVNLSSCETECMLECRLKNK